MKMYKNISEIIMLLHIPYYLDTILHHVFLDIGVYAYGSSKYFDTMHSKYIQSKIMHNVLKACVILQKKFSPICESAPFTKFVIKAIYGMWNNNWIQLLFHIP